MEGTRIEHDFWQLFSLIKNQNFLDINSLYYKMGARMSGPIFGLFEKEFKVLVILMTHI
jgi:carbohydrate-selective porin OprB